MRGVLLFAGLACAALSGCSSGAPTTGRAAAPAGADLLRPLVMATKPDTALSVDEALKAEEGATVVVTGKVPPATTKPFNGAVAAFLLMDAAKLGDPDVEAELQCDDAAT